ncbi:MAG: TonB-dependent receptor plug, partial [Candidatus Eremiobacteraeota bacterium]|nr:TonB-dependent receptor plug [Candidatus Eremiobacteraeota bacterium]
MTRRSTQRCLSMAMAVLFLVLAAGAGAFAGTTGTISGTVTDAATGKAITGLTVAAASPSQQQQTTTNGAGFYVLQNLGPDTYTVTISGEGYDAVTVSGVTVQQDQTFAVDQRIAKKLQTIGRIASRAPSNLVNGTQGTDVYNISGQQ